MRAQAHTLESFVAALLVVSVVLFAVQSTAVTPLSASTSNQHIENQQGTVANNLLTVSAADGTLRRAVTYYNESRFEGATDQGFYANGGPPNAFGRALNETFGDERVAFNVAVRYHLVNTTGPVGEVRMVYMGKPSDNAAGATKTIALYDDTSLSSRPTTVSEAADEGSFYAADVSSDSKLFNVLEVHIVVWRM